MCYPPGLNYKAGLADMPDCTRSGSGLEEMAEHAFYYCERVRPFWDHVGEWMARIEPKQLVLLDVGYVVDNVLPSFQGEKRMVFLAILAMKGGRHVWEGLDDYRPITLLNTDLFEMRYPLLV